METDSIQRQKRNTLRRNIVIGLVSLFLFLSLMMALVIYITTGEEDVSMRIEVVDTEHELVVDSEMELLEAFNKKYLKNMSILHKPEIENLERCDDENIYCTSWASSGFCLTNPGYMHLHCKLSCEKCSPSKASCSDGDTNCQLWAATGECNRNPYFMKSIIKVKRHSIRPRSIKLNRERGKQLKKKFNNRNQRKHKKKRHRKRKRKRKRRKRQQIFIKMLLEKNILNTKKKNSSRKKTIKSFRKAVTVPIKTYRTIEGRSSPKVKDEKYKYVKTKTGKTKINRKNEIKQNSGNFHNATTEHTDREYRKTDGQDDLIKSKKVKCKSSCGLCGDCVDKSESCLQLAKDGFCRSKTSTTINYNYMVDNCQKSCGFCGEVPSYLLDQHSCWRVSSVPQHVMEKYKLEEGFYTKYTEAYGFPVLSSKAVDSRALMRMCYLVRWVHASHKEARAAAHANYVRFVIIGKNQRTTSLPEFRWLGPSWDERARGFGGHVTAASEENLLHFDKNKWKNMDMGLHEVSHNVHLSGLERGKPALFKAIEKAYMSAMAGGKYFLDGEAMYARGDFREYFAEGTNSFLGDTWKDRPPHNADELELYDPTLFKIMSKVYPCNPPQTFIFLHNDIDQILSRQSRLKLNYPGCELEPSSNIPDETEIRLKKLKKKRKREIYSWSREKCKLPSKFNGKKYNRCIITEESRRGAWCPTQIDKSGVWYESLLPSHQNTWAFCQQQNPEPKRCSNTTSGKPCRFPFTYLGIKHVSCQGTGWCATKVGRRRTMVEWSTCAAKCYSAQENEHKVKGLTNLS